MAGNDSTPENDNQKPKSGKGSRPDNINRNKDNQWWKMRASHGRKLSFKDANNLWESCQEYFDATDKRKWKKVDFRGKDNNKVKIPTQTPYTLSGLCLFLDVSTSYFNEFETRINSKPKEKVTKKDRDFMETISRVRQIIYTQKFEGAAVNAFNATIISRELGMYDKVQLGGDKDNPIVISQITGMDVI